MATIDILKDGGGVEQGVPERGGFDPSAVLRQLRVEVNDKEGGRNDGEIANLDRGPGGSKVSVPLTEDPDQQDDSRDEKDDRAQPAEKKVHRVVPGLVLKAPAQGHLEGRGQVGPEPGERV